MCCIRAKVFLFRLSICIRARRLYSGKVVVFGQGGFIRVRLFFSGKIGCIRAKVVVFGQSGCKPAKVVVFGEKLLYWGK